MNIKSKKFKSHKRLKIRELETELKKSDDRLNELIKGFATDYNIIKKNKFDLLEQENLKLQRELSLCKNEETAMSIEWKLPWNTGAPCPHVISSGHKTFLIYFANVPDPNWDGSYVNIIDTKSDQIEPLALVEFINCYIYKFGGANDEVIHGHPLWRKGLEYYGAHLILNSKWLREEEKTNSVHSQYNKDGWKNINHYLLLFHDQMFECIATNYKMELIKDSFSNVLTEAKSRLLSCN